MQKKERNRVAILSLLKKRMRPLTSAQLAESLTLAGHPMSERSVRLYLTELDAEHLTEPLGKKGRMITQQGLEELRAAQTLERVGYLSSRIDQMTYAMNFNLQTSTGTVVVNTSIVQPKHLLACLDRVCQVFAQGYAMGTRLAVLRAGESVGDFTIPEDRIGLCTVCSITLNGILLKHGIPTTSRFGGLLELRDGRPTRFVELIHYDATSIDPLEVFIRGGMTDYSGAIRDGNGLIGASFREMPEAARDLVLQLSKRLADIGLGGFVEIGSPGQSLMGVPPSEGRVGSVVIGGLNPIAILEESGYRVRSRALAGLLDYHRLVSYEQLGSELKRAS